MHTALKLFAMTMLLVVAFTAATMLFYCVINLGTSENNRISQEGILDLAQEQTLDELVLVSGEWEVFKGERLTPSQLADRTAEYVSLPYLTAPTDNLPATFRLKILTNSNSVSNSPALYINSKLTDTDIYLNGELVWSSANKKSSVTAHDRLVSNLHLSPDGEQELVISTSNGQLSMFQSKLKLASFNKLSAHLEINYIVKFFLVGILVVFLIVGLSFMSLHSRHVFISTLALFDFFIIARTLFSMPEMYEVLFAIAGREFLPAEVATRILIFCYLIACIFDCRLSCMFFRIPSSSLEVVMRRRVTIALAALSLILPSSLLGFRIAIIAFSSWSLISRIVWGVRSLRHNHNLFDIFKAVRVFAVAMVLAFDSHSLTGFIPGYEIILYLYCSITVVHLIMRLWNNFKTYVQANELNQNLETLVDKRTAQLTEANEKLAKLSIHDPLTGAFNRLHFENRIDAILRHSENPESICLAILDIDHFKDVNDSFGHDAGDEVLKHFVRIIQANLAQSMSLYRIGGEEFVVFSHTNSPYEFIERMEQIRIIISHNFFPHEKQVTASIGVSVYQPGYTLKSMLKEADTCLYEAKNTGRNKLVHHSELITE